MSARVPSVVVMRQTTIQGANLRPLPRRRKPKPSLAEAACLAAARAAKRDADAAEARKLAAAVEWAALHEVDDPDLAETWADTPITLGGEGAPMIATGCVAEFAAVIGTSTGGGRYYLSDAIELAHRLPQLYARVLDGAVPAWKARRIANQTTDLTPEAVAALDDRIAPVAQALSAARADKMIAQARWEFMPVRAQEIADAIYNQHVLVKLHQVSHIGTAEFHGSLDYADAVDLEEAIAREAQVIQDEGYEGDLDARRAKALGRLARGEASGPGAGREMVMYVHLPAQDNGAAVVDGLSDRHLLAVEQVKNWVTAPNTKVLVKPVIDLNKPLSTSAYEIPDKIREHVVLRDGTCIFVNCDRPAVRSQIDHTAPYDENGPPGQTNTDNLASLCQHHHNLKTHAGWSYTTIEPGVYLWRSPHGYRFLRDQHGTTELTPPPVDPPGG